MSIFILFGGICTLLGFAVLILVGCLAARHFLAKSGVDVTDGISADELATMVAMLREQEAAAREAERKALARARLLAAAEAIPTPATAEPIRAPLPIQTPTQAAATATVAHAAAPATPAAG